MTIASRGNGVSEITVSGSTPHFWSQLVSVPADHKMLTFDYFSPGGAESFAVRFRDAMGGMKFTGSKALPLAETWQPFAIELSALPKAVTRFHFSLKARPRFSFQIRNFRLRAPNQSELLARKNRDKTKAARETDANAFLEYLRASYPGEIEEVAVGLETVRISGKSSVPIRLVELPPQVTSHRSKSPHPSHPVADNEQFTIELSRYAGKQKRDRAVSRWRLETKTGQVASLAKWPTRTAIPVTKVWLPKAVAKSQKGIGGVPIINRDDHPIFELGVYHATVNEIGRASCRERV